MMQLPEGVDFPTWLAIGANQGATSYMGILHCAQLKKDDTVVISAAAGKNVFGTVICYVG